MRTHPWLPAFRCHLLYMMFCYATLSNHHPSRYKTDVSPSRFHNLLPKPNTRRKAGKVEKGRNKHEDSSLNSFCGLSRCKSVNVVVMKRRYFSRPQYTVAHCISASLCPTCTASVEYPRRQKRIHANMFQGEPRHPPTQTHKMEAIIEAGPRRHSFIQVRAAPRPTRPLFRFPPPLRHRRCLLIFRVDELLGALNHNILLILLTAI